MISQEKLKEYLQYDQITGDFTWIKKPTKSMAIGTIAGCLGSHGYLRININFKTYQAHRLAFLYMTGFMPEQVDHINHNRGDNRWVNLRGANNSINSKNRSMHPNNTSGCSGVSFVKKARVWRSVIDYNGDTLYLGGFKHKVDAVIARKMAEFKYGFHENHGDKKLL